jgi:hypothetical protein
MRSRTRFTPRRGGRPGGLAAHRPQVDIAFRRGWFRAKTSVKPLREVVKEGPRLVGVRSRPSAQREKRSEPFILTRSAEAAWPPRSGSEPSTLGHLLVPKGRYHGGQVNYWCPRVDIMAGRSSDNRLSIPPPPREKAGPERHRPGPARLMPARNSPGWLPASPPGDPRAAAGQTRRPAPATSSC